MRLVDCRSGSDSVVEMESCEWLRSIKWDAPLIIGVYSQALSLAFHT